MLSELTDRERDVYATLYECLNADVGVNMLYRLAYEGERLASNRTMQQRLGPIIARINRKLPDGHRIVPGELKRTYRLNTNYKA